MRPLGVIIVGGVVLVLGAAVVVGGYVIFQVLTGGGTGSLDGNGTPGPTTVAKQTTPGPGGATTPAPAGKDDLPVLPTPTQGPGTTQPSNGGQATPGATAPAKATPAPTGQAEGQPATVSGTGGTGLILRAEPSTSAGQVAVMPEGAEVVVLDTREAEGREWSQVRYNNELGWAASEFIETQ